MKNITLALDEKIIEEGRKYARKHHMTLNSLIRKLLEQTVLSISHDWIGECFSLMDKVEIPHDPQDWKREDIYRV